MGHEGQMSASEEGASPSEIEFPEAPELLLGIRRAVAEIMMVREAREIRRAAAQALATNTLFERVFVTFVRDGSLQIEGVHFDDGREQAETIFALWRAEPPALTHLIIESEVVRKSRAILVLDTRRKTIGGALGKAIASDSYVAAPLVSEGRCIGMIHADRKISGRSVGEAERDGLWLYCQAVSLALIAADRAERLDRQRAQVKRHLVALDGVLDETSAGVPDGDMSLAHSSDLQLAAAGVVLAPDHRIHSLLTTRELEVLQLMAQGRTNAEIAGELVIAEGTVKSHVKHVLRKMRAGNRTEAVTRYIKLTS